ncbi:hypothetical protein FA95DRAFT_1504144, partial [Auriscalpium vulgare]
PSRVLEHPGPIVTQDGEQEWEVDKIMDQRRRGRSVQYVVRWRGWGDEDM